MTRYQKISIVIAIVSSLFFTFSFRPSETCPYGRLSRWTNPEIFVAVGAIANDQNILNYDPEEHHRYDCIEDVTVCTYYLDWDGYIRQCEEGYFVP